MGDFVAALRERLRRAREALASARAGDDAYAVQVAAGDLDGVLRLARENGIDVDDDRADAGCPAGGA